MRNDNRLFSTYTTENLLSEKKAALARRFEQIENSDPKTLANFQTEELYKLEKEYSVELPTLEEKHTDLQFNDKDRTITVGIVFRGDARFFQTRSPNVFRDWERPVGQIVNNAIFITFPMGGDKVIYQGMEIERPLVDTNQVIQRFKQSLLEGLREMNSDISVYHEEIHRKIINFLNKLNEKKELAAKYSSQKEAILKQQQG